MASTAHVEVVEEEGDNDAAAQVDENDDGVDIEDGFVNEYDVRIDFGVKIGPGVKIGIGEKTDRDEMVDVVVKNIVGV
jgi:hypothetical protein